MSGPLVDSLDTAIAEAEKVIVETLPPISTGIKRRDGSITGFKIELPSDLDDEVLVAVMRSVGEIGDSIILQKQRQQPKPLDLVLVKGSLPKEPGA